MLLVEYASICFFLNLLNNETQTYTVIMSDQCMSSSNKVTVFAKRCVSIFIIYKTSLFFLR